MINYRKLADGLDSIALDECYNEDHIFMALCLNITAFNDKEMLRRYLKGEQTSEDCFDLQRLAISIREVYL